MLLGYISKLNLDFKIVLKNMNIFNSKIHINQLESIVNMECLFLHTLNCTV